MFCWKKVLSMFICSGFWNYTIQLKVCSTTFVNTWSYVYTTACPMVHFVLQLQVQNPLSNVPYVDCDSLAHLYSQNNRTHCFVDQIDVALYWQIYLTTRIEGLRAKRVYMFRSICASFSLFARRPSIMSDINCTFFWNVRLLFQTSC